MAAPSYLVRSENRPGSHGPPRFPRGQNPSCNPAGRANHYSVSPFSLLPAYPSGKSAGACRRKNTRSCCLDLALGIGAFPPQNRPGSHGPPRFPHGQNPSCNPAGRGNRYSASPFSLLPAYPSGKSAGACRRKNTRSCRLGPVRRIGTGPPQNRPGSHGPPRFPHGQNPSCNPAGRGNRYSASPFSLLPAYPSGKSAGACRRKNMRWSPLNFE